MRTVRRVTPQMAAVSAYSEMWESLTIEAQVARIEHRPYHRRHALYWSRIVLRAIEAEERDPEPKS